MSTFLVCPFNRELTIDCALLPQITLESLPLRLQDEAAKEGGTPAHQKEQTNSPLASVGTSCPCAAMKNGSQRLVI